MKTHLSRQQNESGTMAKILIADDDEHQRVIIGATIRSAEFQVFFASNGSIALEMAKKEIPDVIVLDVNMPGLDGFQVTSLLRAEDTTKAIPIILLTSLGRDEDIRKGMEAGASDYFIKPYHPVELLDRIYSFLPGNPG